MNSTEAISKCEHLIDDLLELRQQQDEVDRWYDRFIVAFQEEMRKFFKEVKDSPQAQKNLRLLSKPWWNDDLTVLNKSVHKQEKLVRQLKKAKKHWKKALLEFKEAQNKFDKEVRKCKRRWQREEVMRLESANTDDPVEFWRQIQNMGRKPKKKLPE